MSAFDEDVRRISFSKYQGLGNDFIIIDGKQGFITASSAQRLCDRRFGIGADGVLTILAPRDPEAQLRMHVFNADGSVAEMCGNGLRCVVQHVGRYRTSVNIDTDAGLRKGWVHSDGQVSVTLGEAHRLSVQNIGEAVAISMGNPHLVLPPTNHENLRQLAEVEGPQLEKHASFPDRVNVGFLRVSGPRRLDLVVFERGVGVTMACGTGAAAAAAAAGLKGWVESSAESVQVGLPGGVLEVEIDPKSADEGSLGQVTIRGAAVEVFQGEIEIAEHELHAEPS